jgi:hypothetical protein
MNLPPIIILAVGVSAANLEQTSQKYLLVVGSYLLK